MLKVVLKRSVALLALPANRLPRRPEKHFALAVLLSPRPPRRMSDLEKIKPGTALLLGAVGGWMLSGVWGWGRRIFKREQLAEIAMHQLSSASLTGKAAQA